MTIKPDTYTRYIVLTVDGPLGGIDDDLHQLVRDLADVARHWNGRGYAVHAEDRDGRDVIDAEFAQDWQDMLDADGADQQPRFGYPIPAFLKSVAALGDADDMREDDRTDTLDGIITWARDYTGLSDEPGAAPSRIIEVDDDEDVEGCSCGMADKGTPGHDEHDED